MNAYMLNEMTYDCDVHGSFGRTLTLVGLSNGSIFKFTGDCSEYSLNCRQLRCSNDTLYVVMLSVVKNMLFIRIKIDASR